jgi:phosphoribosylamine--glycine ligase
MLFMKVLVVGGGGREHALVWKLKQSPRVSKIFCAPGNAGIGQLAELVELKDTGISGLADFAEENRVDLTVVGPEAPLIAGLVDEFERRGLSVFGPSKAAAELEGSKAFAKAFMDKYSIPTAKYRVFEDALEAQEYVRAIGAPLVVKADGIAAGKGVIVASSEEEAIEAINKIMVERAFGQSGNKILIEEKLEGEEATLLAFSDGNTIVPMVSSQDHKAVYDGDKGPNTGGMGAYSPAPIVTSEVMQKAMDDILIPTIKGMKAEGRLYKGVLYAGLMIKDGQLKVLEFNVRFGDPETQVVLPRLKTDIVDIMEAVIKGRLHEMELEWDDRLALCVVLASGGYPGSYEKGKPIVGLEELVDLEDITSFHSGTSEYNGKIVTSGGRVLGITALGNDVNEARQKAYHSINRLSFEGMHFRKDIGIKALVHM